LAPFCSEKDRQIFKIEEEKHQVRERELGKNYLLETYLKDLDEPQEKGEDLELFEEMTHIDVDRDFGIMSGMNEDKAGSLINLLLQRLSS